MKHLGVDLRYCEFNVKCSFFLSKKERKKDLLHLIFLPFIVPKSNSML